MPTPSLILVHGSWHHPQHWSAITKDLEAYGYKCIAVDLPSSQSPDEPPARLSDDSHVVRSTVLAELDAGNDVVVVAHSYGGHPTSNSLKGLDEESRKASGSSASIKAIVFLAAIPTFPGKTFRQVMMSHEAPNIHDIRVPGFSWPAPPGPSHWFYNEQSAEDAEYASSLLRQASLAAGDEEATYAAYMDIPSYYLRCTKDRALPYDVQGQLLNDIEAAGGRIEIETIGECSPSTADCCYRGLNENRVRSHSLRW